jgi:hypothetical protein
LYHPTLGSNDIKKKKEGCRSTVSIAAISGGAGPVYDSDFRVECFAFRVFDLLFGISQPPQALNTG